MAYSYEQIQGPQHIQLAYLLDDTSFYLNSTVTTLLHEVSDQHVFISYRQITYLAAIAFIQ